MICMKDCLLITPFIFLKEISQAPSCPSAFPTKPQQYGFFVFPAQHPGLHARKQSLQQLNIS